MTRTAVTTNRLAWHDRWSKPTLENLLEPLKINHRRQFTNLVEKMTAFEDLSRSITWFGPSWKWTIIYSLTTDLTIKNASKIIDSQNMPGAGDAFCYLVPNVDNPLICIPLSDENIAQLPKKRIGRFINDGIKTAKCAIKIHWATWTPNNEPEVGFLMDLVKRKHDFLTQQMVTA